MSKEKQTVEEMAKVIGESLLSVLGVRLNDDILARLAEHPYNAGYHKQSEVALDVIRKVKNKVRKYKHNMVNPYEHIILYLNELEKKYTEEQNNENKNQT